MWPFQNTLWILVNFPVKSNLVDTRIPADFLQCLAGRGNIEEYNIAFFWGGENFFSFIFISWRLITLQYCSGFCHIFNVKVISYFRIILGFTSYNIIK